MDAPSSARNGKGQKVWPSVTLGLSELKVACDLGVRCQLLAMREGRKDAHGFDDPLRAWGIHILGAAGEMACAKALGIYYDLSNGTYRTRADLMSGLGVSHDLEVRTRSRPSHDLLLTHDDSDTAPYVLVLGDLERRRFGVRGWAWGSEGKQAKWYRQLDPKRPACFVVPQAELRPLSELVEVIG